MKRIIGLLLAASLLLLAGCSASAVSEVNEGENSSQITQTSSEELETQEAEDAITTSEPTENPVSTPKATLVPVPTPTPTPSPTPTPTPTPIPTPSPTPTPEPTLAPTPTPTPIPTPVPIKLGLVDISDPAHKIEALQAYPNYEYFEQYTENVKEVVIHANTTVSNVSLIYGSLNENLEFVAGETIYTAAQISPDYPFVFKYRPIGVGAPYGITYQDHDGQIKTLILSEDGAIGNAYLSTP